MIAERLTETVWREWTALDDLLLAQMRAAGFSSREIALELDRSPQAVMSRACRLRAGRLRRPPDPRNFRHRHKGWMVLYCEGLVARKFRAAATEEEARALVREMNQLHPHRLYWTEWWSTSSTLDNAAEAEYARQMREGVVA